MGRTRTQRPRSTTGLIFLSTLLLGLAGTASASAATPVMSGTTIKWGTSATATLPNVPSGTTAVRLTLSAEWAWKTTRLSVCAGSSATTACKATVALQVPAQQLASTTVTVPLPTSAGNKITVFNADASARVSVAVESYVTAAAAAAPVTGPAGAATTGVPDGTKLTVHEGDLFVTKPGTVIDSLDVRGLVRIQASNVVIKRTLIRGRPLSSSMALITNDLGKYSFTVEDSSLIAANASPWISGIIGHNFTVRRTEIANVIDSVHITGSNVTVADSWLHANLYYASDPSQGGGPSHADSIQIQAGNNLVFARNRIEGARSSAMQTTQDRGAISNVTVQDNRISGGACSINVAYGKYGPISGFSIRDNTFGLDTRNARCAIVAPSPTAVSNVSNEFTDGSNVTLTRGW